MHHHRPARNNVAAQYSLDLPRNNSKFIPLRREIMENSVDQEFSLPDIGESEDEQENMTM